jgi:hypothetical protein
VVECESAWSFQHTINADACINVKVRGHSNTHSIANVDINGTVKADIIEKDKTLKAKCNKSAMPVLLWSGMQTNMLGFEK